MAISRTDRPIFSTLTSLCHLSRTLQRTIHNGESAVGFESGTISRLPSFAPWLNFALLGHSPYGWKKGKLKMEIKRAKTIAKASIVLSFLVWCEAVQTVLADATFQVSCEFPASSNTAPWHPHGPLTEAGGNFYGTTSSGGINGNGTVFRVTSAGVSGSTIFYSTDLTATGQDP